MFYAKKWYFSNKKVVMKFDDELVPNFKNIFYGPDLPSSASSSDIINIKFKNKK